MISFIISENFQRHCWLIKICKMQIAKTRKNVYCKNSKKRKKKKHNRVIKGTCCFTDILSKGVIRAGIHSDELIPSSFINCLLRARRVLTHVLLKVKTSYGHAIAL